MRFMRSFNIFQCSLSSFRRSSMNFPTRVCVLQLQHSMRNHLSHLNQLFESASTVISKTNYQQIRPSITNHTNENYNRTDVMIENNSGNRITAHPNKKFLSIDSKELQIVDLRLPYLWLRDSCKSAHSVDPQTSQKLFKTSDIPINIHPLRAKIYRNKTSSKLELSIDWSHNLNPRPDSFKSEQSVFELLYLKDAISSSQWNNSKNKAHSLSRILWSTNGSTLNSKNNPIKSLNSQNDLFIDYSLLKDNPEVVLEALKRMNKLGLVFFKNVGTEELELGELIRSLGLDIRRTFYGDLWNVQSEGKEAKNVASTSHSLDFHMDLVHFQNPPRFQFLHCLKNRVKGGESGFVDSYSVILEILRNSPELFKTLSEEEVQFEYVNNNHHTFYSHRTIELQPNVSPDSIIVKPDSLFKSLISVNYSPPFQAPFDPKVFYEQGGKTFNNLRFENLLRGLREFERICRSEEMGFEIKLEEGQCVAFDNRRILHARKSFEDSSNSDQVSSDKIMKRSEKPEIRRWLKGCYVDGDSVWDRLRVLS
ncbi:taurine catabolism dioxygenase TauD, TfdA family-domain-containing protein [Phakopsora pachyrhizi]|nr:taurine catabolism dioxygenase TauD, TfdA family-domain-containing protein [Phakopsora pachyrhizi]